MSPSCDITQYNHGILQQSLVDSYTIRSVKGNFDFVFVIGQNKLLHHE